MALVKGIHHVALKCCSQEEYEEVIRFYGEILGIPEARRWAGGIMFSTGSGLIEVFNECECRLDQGTIRHFALATDDTDACVAAVSAAGYEVFVAPKEISIPSNPVFPARIAFCKGPLGEEIEFFQEK